VAAAAAIKSLGDLCGVLGLLTKEEDELPENVRSMVTEREAARKNKDWKKSDELRDALKEAGYIVEDTKQGQKVRKNV
jgi:cysteinyl-tRNA synthetase